jgi:NitT/TauT family transport system permease protein
MKAEKLTLMARHAVFVAVLLAALESAAQVGWLDPSFFGRPSGVLKFLLVNVPTKKFWMDLAWSMAGTLVAFSIGSVAAVFTGLLFVARPQLERFLEPYLSALNVMPRIALAPLFLLWFGIGLGSKVAVGSSLTFFIVLSATVAGIRGVSQDHLTLCRTLGASATSTFLYVTLPGAVPVIFSGLRLGLIASTLGVIGAEIIAAEHGLGQSLAYLGSTFNIDGVMALLLVLALLGVTLMRFMERLEARLLRWQ